MLSEYQSHEQYVSIIGPIITVIAMAIVILQGDKAAKAKPFDVLYND
jgi:hypothetical protein